MAERDLSSMTNEELYAFKDRLQTMRDQVKGRRGPGPTHTRGYCRTMREQINAVLKSRNAPLRPLGSEQRVYGPGAAPWQKDAGQDEVPELLMGLPIHWTEKIPALQQGDIVLGDFSCYMDLKLKPDISGPEPPSKPSKEDKE